MLSKFIRKTHMYLALFLSPWILLYAISSITMNHQAAFKRYHGGEAVRWEKEREQALEMQFSADAKPEFIGEQILRHLDLEGNFRVEPAKNDQTLTIFRNDPITPRRISYTRASSSLLIEKQEFRIEPRLSELHRRRGFQTAFLVDDLWATMVDLAVAGILFWVLSGLWMCWELKVTRVPGALFALAGFAIYGLFVFSI